MRCLSRNSYGRKRGMLRIRRQNALFNKNVDFSRGPRGTRFEKRFEELVHILSEDVYIVLLGSDATSRKLVEREAKENI